MPVYRGWNAKLYLDSVQVGHVKEVRVDIDHSLEYYFEAGTRLPATTIEGPINIKGRISRAWVDINYLSLLNNTDVLDTFTLCVEISTTYPVMVLYLYNCKFHKGSVSVPQDGILTEDYDFLATSFNIAWSEP